MKRSAKILSVILLVTLCILSLFSCNDKSDTEKDRIDIISELEGRERAFALLELADEVLLKAESFNLYEQMSIYTPVKEEVANIKLNYDVAVSAQNTEGFALKSVYTYNDQSTSSKDGIQTVTEGYQDGKMYFSTDNLKLKIDFSAKNYFDEWENGYEPSGDADLFDLDFHFFEVAVSEKVDENWRISLSDYDEDGIKDILNLYHRTFYLPPEYTIEDVVATVDIKEDFSEYSCRIDFRFKTEVDVTSQYKAYPEIYIVFGYKDVNKTEIEKEDLDTFTESADFRMLNKASSDILAKRISDSDEFTLHLDQEKKIGGGEYESVLSEVDDVRYGRNDKGFLYSVYATVDGSLVVVDYYDGQLYSEGVSAKSDDVTQQSYIYNLMTLLGIKSADIIDFQAHENEENTYVVTLKSTPYTLKLLGVSGEVHDEKYTVTLSFDDEGNLKTYLVKIGFTSRKEIDYIITAKTEFK